MNTIIPIRFCGIDSFDRAVFATLDEKTFYKTVELMPRPSWTHLSREERDDLLLTLHDTDGFDGEPGCPVPPDRFEVLECM